MYGRRRAPYDGVPQGQGTMSETMSDAGRADAINRLNGPSIAVISMGVLSALYSIFTIGTGLLGMAMGTSSEPVDIGELGDVLSGQEQQMAEQIQQIMAASSGPLGIVTSFMMLMTSLVIIAGGVKMRTAEMYSLCVVAAALCMIPCTSCCCCLGLPIGIWALVVLLDQNVKAAFR